MVLAFRAEPAANEVTFEQGGIGHINILPQDAFVIFDSDRDGVLESGGFLTLTSSEWQSGGWSLLSTFNSVY